ncbi:MAG TPA: thioredoxin family protein [Methanoregula sp.]|nr:thioredoxin family protein [Methanoregula sp.]
MDKTIGIAAIVFVVIALVCGVALLGNSHPQTAQQAVILSNGNLTVTYFYGAECPHCAAVKPVIANLTEKYPQVTFNQLEVWHNQTNQATMNGVNAQLGVTDAGVPEVVVGTTVLIGDRDIPAKLDGVIQDYLKKKP